MGTNIIASQVKTPIQNYFEKVLYENLTFDIPPLCFRGIKKNRNKPLWSMCTFAANKERYKYFFVHQTSCSTIKKKCSAFFVEYPQEQDGL